MTVRDGPESAFGIPSRSRMIAFAGPPPRARAEHTAGDFRLVRVEREIVVCGRHLVEAVLVMEGRPPQPNAHLKVSRESRDGAADGGFREVDSHAAPASAARASQTH
jgi:hypothetical protein